MSKKMAVVGAGAAGSYIGAFLTREGHDVTILDMWGAVSYTHLTLPTTPYV